MANAQAALTAATFTRTLQSAASFTSPSRMAATATADEEVVEVVEAVEVVEVVESLVEAGVPSSPMTREARARRLKTRCATSRMRAR